MPYSGGIYTPPAGATNAVPGQVLQSSVWDAIFTDIAATFNDPGGRIRYFKVVARTVNFNSVADTTIPIVLPTSETRYRVTDVTISGASGTLTTATFGLFTAAAGGGVALIAGATAITVNTASANTNNNMQVVQPANPNTQSFNVANLFFRVTNPQGVAATADVSITIEPM